ncbi:hypothetical protein J7E95_39685 [Streptomyces sp. ISL-14]|nr:hypothetical protein [Streptomyces sp. ISL-14]
MAARVEVDRGSVRLEHDRGRPAAASRAVRQRGIEARPPAPEWLLERGLSGRDAVYVHVGDCWGAGKRPKGISREEALRALAEGIKPCPQCEPDNALGFLD